MSSERDIWASAKLYVDLYEDNAMLEAGIRVDAALAQGDLDSNRRWKSIMQAITWLQDNRGRDPFKVEH